MKKTFKNFEIEAIVNMLAGSNGLLNSDKEMDVTFLWNLDKNFRTLNNLATQIGELKEKLQRKYSNDEMSDKSTDDDGNEVRIVKSEYINKFQQEMQDLLMIENEVEIATVPFESLKKLGTLSGKELNSVRFMIEDDK